MSRCANGSNLTKSEFPEFRNGPNSNNSGLSLEKNFMETLIDFMVSKGLVISYSLFKFSRSLKKDLRKSYIHKRSMTKNNHFAIITKYLWIWMEGLEVSNLALFKVR